MQPSANKPAVRRVVPVVKSLTAKQVSGAISGALLAATAVLVPSAAVAVDTCHGQAATISPDSNGRLTGTPGPDVIVAFADQRVDAGAGDDLICVVASTPGSDVDAGPGDDTVDTTRSFVATVVSLGEGEDTLIGGRGEDDVYGSAPEGLGEHGINPLDTERDVISTGGGDDKVFSGSLGSPNLDKLTTGAGSDRIDIVGLDHTLELDAGPGTNTAIVTLSATETTAWVVDEAKRSLHFDEATSHWKGDVQRWYFTLAAGSTPSSLVFLGTRTDEQAFVSGKGLVPHFRMGGGNDWAGSLTTPGGSFALGAGHDRLTLGKYDDINVTFPIEDLRVDLRAHRARFGPIESPVWGVEELIAGASLVRAFGTGGGEKITANGCDVAVWGRSGPDRLVRGRDVISLCGGDVNSRIYGGRGNDILWGSQITDDLLVGGPGFDRARGMSGTDTCYTEVARGCELP